MKDYYKILSVQKTDDTKIIKQKTKNLINSRNFTIDELKNIKEAYKVLTSYFLRVEYDNYLNKLQTLQIIQPFNIFNNLINKNNYSKVYSYSSSLQKNKDGKYVKKEKWNNNGE